MNHFFSIVISCEKAKNVSEVMRIRCTFSLKIQFFIMFDLTLGPDFEIFSQFQEMRLESLLLNFLEMRLWMHFSLKIQFVIMFGLTLGPDFEIFSQFLEMRLWITSSEKAKNGYEVMRIRCNFSLKIQFFIMFGLTLGPDFEIFSQFQEMCLWITFLHRNILRKSGKQFWSFVDPMHLFIKDSIFHNVWPNFGPRFWDIFSISGNALMNHFFAS